MWTAPLLAFLQSFDEPLIALFASGIDARTLAEEDVEQPHSKVDPTIAAGVYAWLVTLAVGLLRLLWRSSGRRAPSGSGALRVGPVMPGGRRGWLGCVTRGRPSAAGGIGPRRQPWRSALERVRTKRYVTPPR